MKQKTAFQRVMAFLLSAVLMLSLCTTAFAAQPGRVEPQALLVGEEFSIVVNYGYMENGNFVKTGSKTMVSTCCDKTGHSGYNHTMDAAKIVKESGYTYTDWRVTRYGYWDTPASTTQVNYTISGKAPYKADQAIWVIGEKPTIEPGNPGGDGNGEGTDREETVRLGSGSKHHWMQTFVFHANYPGGRDPKVTVKYDITAHTTIYNANLKAFDACGFTLPDGYVLKTDDWYTKADGGSTFRRMGGNYPFEKSNNGKVIHLYAQYTPIQAPVNTFALTYDANGGLVEKKDSHTVTITTTNSSYSFNSFVAVREGYTFLDWYTAANGGEKIKWPYVMSVTGSETSASKTVYAQWKANEVSYTVNRYDNEGTPIDTDTRQGVTDQTVAVTDKDKILEGYTFNTTDARNVLQTVLGSNNELKLYFTKNTPNWEQLQITQTADKEKVKSGDTVTYTIEVTNETGRDLTGITVTEKPDANFYRVEASETDSYADGVWTIDSLKNGEKATLTLTAWVNGTAADHTVITNTVTITSAAAGVETLPENVRPQMVTTVIVDNSPDWTNLTITQKVNQPKARSGMNVLFTIQVTNNTGYDLNGVTVADQMDDNLRFISDDGAGSYADGVWTIGALKKGKTATLTITAQLKPTTTMLEKVTNTATIKTAAAGTATLPEGEGAKAETEVTVDYSKAPKWGQLRVLQFIDRTTVNAGGEVTFLVQLRNKTVRNLQNITVLDVLHPNMTITWVKPEKGSFDKETGIWTIDFMNMGEWASLYITVKVDDTVANGSLLKNTATVTQAFADYEELPEDIVPHNEMMIYVTSSGTGTNQTSALPQ